MKRILAPILFVALSGCSTQVDPSSLSDDDSTSLEGILVGETNARVEDDEYYCILKLKTDERMYGLVGDDPHICDESVEDIGKVVKFRRTMGVEEQGLLRKLRNFDDSLYYLFDLRGYAAQEYDVTRLGDRQWLPREVYDAVKTNYDIGRNNHDFGGISEIEVYNLDGYQGRSRYSDGTVLLDLVKKDIGDIYGLMGECYITFDVGTPFDCVGKLKTLRDDSGEFFRWVSDLKIDSPDDEAGRRLNSALDTITEYIEANTMEDLEVYNFTGFGPNVDILNYIFIDWDKNHAIVVRGDYGA